MADQQQNIAAPFPTPPPFYQHFTKQNLTRLRQLQREARTSQPANELDILSLPPELRYLLPPSPPPTNTYNSFGVPLDLNAPDPTLTSSGIEQLYPPSPTTKLNPQPHLIALSRSLLTTFLSLVGILAQNPVEEWAEKVEGLQTIMFNIHDLINQYRPHHARENLVLMMEERVGGMRDEVRRIGEARVRVEEVLMGLREGGEAEVGLTDGVVEGGRDGSLGDSLRDEQRKRDRQKAAWAAMEEEMAQQV